MAAPLLVSMAFGAAVNATSAVDPGDDALLGILTVTEASGASKTNEPISIIWPMGPDDNFTASDHLLIYDDDGSGNQGSALTNFQAVNLSTDANSKGRALAISGIIPSIGSGATRKLRVYKTSTTEPSGTAITESDLFATSWRVVVTFDIGGTSYVADSNDCNGASGTFSKTAATFHGTYLSGPAETCRVYSLPPKNAGTAHASGDGLRVWLHVYMRKAGTAAVSGGNPITHVKTRVVLRNMDTDRVSPANYLYGLTIERATSLSSGTLISTDYTDHDGNVTRYSFPRSQPAVTLTATGFTTTGAKTWTIPSGSWASDIVGAHIVGDSGAAYVTARNSNTSINVYVYDASASLTSLTSGNWTIEGCGHEYGRKWDFEVNVGTQPTSVAIWGDHDSADTSNSKAALDFLIARKWLLNYSFLYSDVTLSMTNLDLMRADNQVRPFTQLGPEITLMGDVYTDIGGTAERDDIGPQAGWNLRGLTKWSPNGRRKIFENNRYWTGAPYNDVRRLSGSPSAGQLSVSPRADGGTEYRINTAFSGTTIAFPAVTWSPWDGDNSHHPSTSAIPFLLTAELMHLEELQGCEYYSTHLTTDAAYQGSGINKTCFGDASESLRGDAPWGVCQQRGEGYLLRDLAYAYICTPDTANDKLFNAKAYYTTKVQNTWSRADFVKTTYTNGNAGALEDYYDTDGPRYVGYRFNGNIDYGIWQLGYVNLNLELASDLGAVASETTAFNEWFAVGVVGMVNSPDVVADWITAGYFVPRTTPDGTAVQSWADTWRAYCCAPLFQERSAVHRTPATISLSATSGASVTVTVTGSPFANGGSWYAPSGNFLGMWVYEAAGGSGAGRIVSVTNANVVVIDTTVTGGAAFSSTTPTASNCRIPPPHPLDAPAQGSFKGWGSAPAFPLIFRASAAVTANRSGYAVSAQACIDYIDNHDYYADISTDIRYTLEPR